MLDHLANAVRVELPQLNQQDAALAVAAVLSTLGHVGPFRETRVTSKQGCWLRHGPSGRQIGTVLKDTGVCAGQDEAGFTPVLLLAWVGSGMLEP